MTEINQKTVDDALIRGLLARYESLTAGLQRLDEIRLGIESEIAIVDLPPDRKAALMAELLDDTLRAERVPLPITANHPYHLGGINEKEAVSLWLGWSRNSSTGVSGLWGIYEECVEEADAVMLPLPRVIVRLFEPRPYDGDEQGYVDACRLMIEAFARDPTFQLDGMPLDHAHRRIGWLLSENAPEEDNDDVLLASALAATFGRVSGNATPRKCIQSICKVVLHSSNGGNEQAIVAENDATTIVSWVVRVLMEGENAREVARQLKRGGGVAKKVKNEVHQLWLKGTNTIKHRFVSRLYDIIDNAEETYGRREPRI